MKQLTEGALQAKCFQHAWNNLPHTRGRLCAVNNNSHNAAKGALNKAIGVVAGTPDMFLLASRGRTVWLEFKTLEGKQSQAQKEWEKRCTELGHVYKIVNSFEQFLLIIGESC